MAVIVQFVLAIVVYPQLLVFVLTLAIFAAMVAFHIYFIVWYCKAFYVSDLPKIGDTIVSKGKEIKIKDAEI